MISAVFGYIVVIIIVAAFCSDHWFRQTLSIIPTESGPENRPVTEPSFSNVLSIMSSFILPKTQVQQTSVVQGPDTEQEQQTTFVLDEIWTQQTQSSISPSVVSPIVDATTEALKGLLKKNNSILLTTQSIFPILQTR